MSVSDVAVVSRTTALEEQAAGRYPESSGALTEESLAPGALPLPREQLMASVETEDLGVVASLFAETTSDADAIDDALRAGCVGEASSGELVLTPERCEGDEESTTEMAQLVSRQNLHRRQIWDYLRSQAEGASAEDVRRQWRAAHLERVVCGAWVEGGAAAEGWEQKRC